MDNKDKGLDLRIVIGTFFLVVSVILIVTSFITENGSDINRYTGIAFLLFGIIMYLLSRISED